MLTNDEHRTLQVLEDTDKFYRRFHPHGLPIVNPEWLMECGWILTDAGRARLAELREKKGRVI